MTQVAKNPDAGLNYPRILMIQTNSRCNSACIMCPWPKMAKVHPQGEMDDELFTKICRELADHPEVEMVMPYLMNEPLLDKKLPERIDLLKRAAPQATVYILTNGALLDEKLGESLLSSKLDWIGFSIHALYPETYKRITGRSDGQKIIQRVTDFVKRAQDAGKHKNYTMVTFTRMRPFVSEEETKKALAYWKELGVDPVDYQDGYISRAGNVEVIEQDRISRPRISGCKTVWAYRIASILYNGEMAPCCMDWNREVSWGNLRDQTIDEIWNGDKRRQFMGLIHSGKELPPGFLCTRCEDAIPAKEDQQKMDQDDIQKDKDASDEAELMGELEQLLDQDPEETCTECAAESDRNDFSPALGQAGLGEALENLEERISEMQDRWASLLEKQNGFLASRKKND